ncbi:MAG: putative DNA binding domain-containing protein [Candidatus Omnitrophica bacterium]|nr:putative DNA binding domain-containing protein [Candidatus Omnitrophota bacterium]
MPEQQNIEYKTNWHDDYLKWVCGFANANGGVLYIGIDDHGHTVGVLDYKKLMEDLPNKIHDLLGVMAEVKLKKKNGLYFIEIVVPRYSVPISFRGRYYYRSGSVKKELMGNALNEFLLKKSGKSWDEVVEQGAKITDIDKASVNQFLESAKKAGRFPSHEKLSLKELLDKLRLLDKCKLRRAAIILFGKDPGKFHPSLTVRIGRFGKSETDLRFEEAVEGNLIYCLQEVLDQLNRKFLVRPISFEGIHRVEKGEYPVAALREVLLNALVHRNYMGAHIQIKIFDDRICVWNDGVLPDDLTIELLKQKHSSRPRNPIIADVCFKGGYIDAWGRGIEKIIDACKEAQLPEPQIEENSGGLLVTLFSDKFTPQVTPQATPQVTPQVVSLLEVINGEHDRDELMNKVGLKDRKNFREIYLNTAITMGLVEMTIPGKPTSSKQKYRLTEKGQAILLHK